jgi:hypothetical protein
LRQKEAEEDEENEQVKPVDTHRSVLQDLELVSIVNGDL